MVFCWIMKRLAIIRPVTPKSPKGSPKSMAQNRTILLASLAVLILQLALLSKASAQAELSLSQGLFSVLVTDNGPGDTNPTLGAITFTGPVGNFSGTFNAGTTKPFVGSALQPQLSLISTGITTQNQGGTLTILFGDIGFGPVTNGNLTAQIGGMGPVSGQVSYQTFMDTGDVPLGLGIGLTTQQPPGGTIFDSVSGNVTFGLNTSLTQQIIITQGPGAVTGLNSTLRITSALATSDTGSAITLFATALLALESCRRRLRTAN